MKTIYLVRHGRTQSNTDGRFQGWEDHPLNEKGLEQAERFAERAGHLKLSAIYVSDLIRTAQTAMPLARRLSLPITPVPALKEISFGEWEGQSIIEIKKTQKEKLAALWRHPTSITLKGGERFEDAQERGWKGLMEIKDHMEEDSSVMVFSHGGMIRLLVCRLLDLPIDSMWRLTLDNTAVCKFQFNNTIGGRLVYLNERGPID
jgi:broad specificity phosphatase PhoE